MLWRKINGRLRPRKTGKIRVGFGAGKARGNRIISMVESCKEPVSEYVRTIEEEEDGIGIMKALAILSAHEHRETSLWRLVEEQHFKNGRLDETHLFVESAYAKPHDYFEPVKMLMFEAEAIAKSYVMAGIEQQIEGLQGDEEED